MRIMMKVEPFSAKTARGLDASSVGGRQAQLQSHIFFHTNCSCVHDQQLVPGFFVWVAFQQAILCVWARQPLHHFWLLFSIVYGLRIGLDHRCQIYSSIAVVRPYTSSWGDPCGVPHREALHTGVVLGVFRLTFSSHDLPTSVAFFSGLCSTPSIDPLYFAGRLEAYGPLREEEQKPFLMVRTTLLWVCKTS